MGQTEAVMMCVSLVGLYVLIGWIGYLFGKEAE